MPTRTKPENRITKLIDGNGDLPTEKHVTGSIPPPNFKTVIFEIVGTTPYVQNRFSSRASTKMRDKQLQGSLANSKKKRDARDFDADYEASKHISADGWFGIPCAGFRKGMVSACRTVGFKMTQAKLGFWIVQDGIDGQDGMPLCRLTKGKPHKVEHTVRNQTGVCDIRARAMFDPGWEAQVTIGYDADMFTAEDIMNLLWRMGAQVGIGEGRQDSKDSPGCGWGGFEIKKE